MTTRCFLLFGLLFLSVASRAADEKPIRAALLIWESAPARTDVQRVADSLVALTQAELSAEPGLEWVERTELDRLLAEVDLAGSGRTDPRTSLRIGKLARAQLLITGRLDATDVARVTLTLEVIDLQHGDLLASSNTPLPVRPHKRYVLRDEDRTTAVAALRSLLVEATARQRQLSAKPALALLFISNSGPSSRLDSAGARLANSLRNSAENAGAHVLRFPRVSDAEGEQDLALLGLSEADDQAWRGVADVYAWGEYKELPADGVAIEQTPVEASLTIWDGARAPRVIPWRGTIATFPEAAAVFSTALRPALRKTTASVPEARNTAAKILSEQATALEKQQAGSFNSPDFWASELGVNFQRHRLFLLQTAAFLQADNTVVRRALFEAKWLPHARKEKLSLKALWKRYTDRCIITERYPKTFNHPDPKVIAIGLAYERSLRARDLEAIIAEIARDLRGEKRLQITEARQAALLWIKEAKALEEWSAQHPGASRSMEEARRFLGDYLIGLGNAPGYPTALGIGIRREMLDGAWPVIAPAFRAWADAEPRFAGDSAESYVSIYAAFGEEYAAYDRLVAALDAPLSGEAGTVYGIRNAVKSTRSDNRSDPSPYNPAWSSKAPRTAAFGVELSLQPHVLYRWFDTPPFRSETARRAHEIMGNTSRLLPSDTMRLLGHDGRRLWLDGFLTPEQPTSQKATRQLAVLSPDTREFTEIGTNIPGESRFAAVAFDAQGVWLASAFEGLTHITVSNAKPAQLTPEDGLPSLKIAAVAAYEAGVVVASAPPERGLARFDAAHSRWINLTLPSDAPLTPGTLPHPTPRQTVETPTLLAGLGQWVLAGKSGIHLLNTRDGAWSNDLSSRRASAEKTLLEAVRQRVELRTRLQQARQRGDLSEVKKITALMALPFEWSISTPQALIADDTVFWIGCEKGLVRFDPNKPAAEAHVIESPAIIALASSGRWLWAAFAPDDNLPEMPGSRLAVAQSTPGLPHTLGLGLMDPPEWRRSRIALYDKREQSWVGSTEVVGGITSLAAADGRLWAAGSTLLEFDTHGVAPPELSKAATPPTPDIAATWLDLPRFPLHEAIERNDLPQLKKLLASREPVDASGLEGWTPLHLASHLGNRAAIDALLASGADLHAFTRDGRNALGLAAARGDLPVVQQFLAAGADPRRQARAHTIALNGLDPARGPAPTSAALQPTGGSVSILPDGRALVHWKIGEHAGQDGFVIYRLNTPADTSAFAAQSLRWGSESSKNRDLGEAVGMMRSSARGWIDSHPCPPGASCTYTVVAVNAFDRDGPPDPASAGTITAPARAPSKTISRTFETHPLDRDRPALSLAAEAGHGDVVSALLKARAPINITDAGGRSALYLACLNDQTEVADQLIDAGAKLDLQALAEAGLPERLFNERFTASGSGAHTALSLVYSAHRNEALFQRLLKAGASSEFGPYGALAPLASSMGREDDLRQLVAAQQNPFATDIYRNTAYTAALNAGRFNLARKLRSTAIDPAHPDWSSSPQFSPITHAYFVAVQRAHLETIQWLRNQGFALSITSESHENPLAEAIKRKSPVAIVSELIAAGADPQTLPVGLLNEVVDPELRKVLTGNPNTIKARLAFPVKSTPDRRLYGAEPEKTWIRPNEKSKSTPTFLRERLHQAAIEGDLPAIRAVLAEGADVDATNEKGQTALFVAIDARQTEAARLLIDSNAELNRVTNFGSSPLCFVAAMGPIELMDEMLDLGADPNLFKDGSASPVLLALKNTAILKRLLESGADPRLLVSTRGMTINAPPLFEMARYGRLDAIQVLVAHGADPKAKIWRGSMGADASAWMQALHFAAMSNDVPCLDYFVNLGLNPAHVSPGGQNALDWALEANAPKTAARLYALGVKPLVEH